MAKSIDQKIFYHGTFEKAVPSIEKEGLKHGYGHLNQGVYISEDWRTALWFGAFLYQIKLKKGTRILDLSIAANIKVIKYLRREFGKALLKADNPLKCIPKNKHLKNNEVVNLLRYFFNKNYLSRYKNKPKNLLMKMEDAVCKYYRGLLIRNGYNGYGHPTNDIGYVIFDPNRSINSAKLRVSVPWKLHHTHFETDFKKFNTLEDLMRKIRLIKK